jgi:hypothetical protein
MQIIKQSLKDKKCIIFLVEIQWIKITIEMLILSE